MRTGEVGIDLPYRCYYGDAVLDLTADGAFGALVAAWFRFRCMRSGTEYLRTATAADAANGLLNYTTTDAADLPEAGWLEQTPILEFADDLRVLDPVYRLVGRGL